MPASKVTILRKINCEQKAIEVDLKCALGDTRQRVVIEPGDMILLEYRPGELFVNTTMSLLQFGGLTRLFTGN
jgi:hypothetical protein